MNYSSLSSSSSSFFFGHLQGFDVILDLLCYAPSLNIKALRYDDVDNFDIFGL